MVRQSSPQVKTNEEYAADYLAARRLTGLSNRGAARLRTYMKRYAAYLSELDKMVCEVGIRDAAEYEGRLKDDGFLVRTVPSYVSAASSFCEWLKVQGVMYANPFREVRRGRIGKAIPKNLPKPKEMDELLTLLGKWEEESTLALCKRRYRMHVLAELLYGTGMRIGEAAVLRATDVSIAEGTVRVIDCKSHKPRLCFLNDYARGVLAFYITRMRKLLVQRGGDYLFESSTAPWLAHDLGAVLAPLCAQLKQPRLTSHCFRHSVGYHMLKAGCDVRYIQEILGHARLTSTQIYTKVDREDLLELIDRFHPRTFSHQSEPQG